MSDVIARQAAEIGRLDAEIERLRAEVYRSQQMARRLMWFIEHLPRDGWGASEVAVLAELREQWRAENAG
ncbi:MAG TPA: hypothetical protein VIG24_01315 [Acidimicrobiia bacterium]